MCYELPQMTSARLTRCVLSLVAISAILKFVAIVSRLQFIRGHAGILQK